jgi:hypothetical protein
VLVDAPEATAPLEVATAGREEAVAPNCIGLMLNMNKVSLKQTAKIFALQGILPARVLSLH